MTVHEPGVRWAANAPSAALLASGLRGDIPDVRREALAPPGYPLPATQDWPPPTMWRIWPLDGSPVRLKRHLDCAHYRSEQANLRFFNAVARGTTPRLLACDDSALALLTEDPPGVPMADIASAGQTAGLPIVQHGWERIVTALAGLHGAAEQRSALFRRLHAPHWPPEQQAPPADLLQQVADRLLEALPARKLTLAERGSLVTAGAWMTAQTAAALRQHRTPILGLSDAYDIILSGARVVFPNCAHGTFGVRNTDLAVTWRLPQRHGLLDRCYLQERSHLGYAIDEEAFWSVDAAIVAGECAMAMLRLLQCHSDGWPLLQDLSTDLAAVGASGLPLSAAGAVIAELVAARQ